MISQTVGKKHVYNKIKIFYIELALVNELQGNHTFPYIYIYCFGTFYLSICLMVL